MDKTFEKIPQRKNTSPVKLNSHLSFQPLIPFENHPSARGLKKNNNEESKLEKMSNINILNEDNQLNSDKQNIKKGNNFTLYLNPIEDKIYQNEVYYTKNDNYCNDINYDNTEIKKKSTLSEKEEQFDREITKSIQNNEKSDIIINKFKNFANIKNN